MLSSLKRSLFSTRQVKYFAAFFACLVVFFYGHSLITELVINQGFLKLSSVLLSDIESSNSLLTETKNIFERLTCEEPDVNTGWHGLGFTLLLAGQIDAAQNIWATNGFSPTEQLLALGNYYLYCKDEPQKALKWFVYLIEINPASDKAWFALGNIREEEGQSNLALQAYDSAWQLNPADTADTLATFLRSQDKVAEAINIWETALKKFPEHSQRLTWWQGLANTYRFQKNWVSAQQSAKNGLLEFPDDPRLYVELGSAIYSGGGNVNEALKYLQKAVTLNPVLAPAYAEIGYIMAREGRYKEAFEWYSRAINLDPGNRSWLLTRANVVRGSGDLLQSIKLYLKIIDLFPRFDAGYYQLAWAYYQNNQNNEAVNTIEQALILNQSPPSDYYTRAGMIYEQANSFEKARSAYRQALKLNPEDVVAQKRLDQLTNQ